MQIPCYYLTVVLDRIGEDFIAFPKIIKTYIIGDIDDMFKIQVSIHNGHLMLVKKRRVFFSESSAHQYVKDNSEEIDVLCKNALQYGKEVYKIKLQKGNVSNKKY